MDLLELIERVRAKPRDVGELTQLRLALHRAALKARAAGDSNRQFAAGLIGDALIFTSKIDDRLIEAIARGVSIVASVDVVTENHLGELRRELIRSGASFTGRTR
jgi:hypothetical protein